MCKRLKTPHPLRALGIVLWLAAAVSCSQDKPAAQKTGGGESALDRAGRNIDQAHKQFKQEVKPAAKKVDETTNAVVGEGKKAVHKVVGGGDGSGQQKPESQPSDK